MDMKYLLEKYKKCVDNFDREKKELEIIKFLVSCHFERNLCLNKVRIFIDNKGNRCYYDNINVSSYDDYFSVYINGFSIIKNGRKGKHYCYRSFCVPYDYFLEDVFCVYSEIKERIKMVETVGDKFSWEWLRRRRK